MDTTGGNDPKQGGGVKKKIGGQPGNHNACKPTHRYAPYLDKRMNQLIEKHLAHNSPTLDEELELLRRLLGESMRDSPDDHRLHLKLIRTITQVYFANEKIGDNPQKRLMAKATRILGHEPGLVARGMMRDQGQ
jgi:hypothetical protein